MHMDPTLPDGTTTHDSLPINPTSVASDDSDAIQLQISGTSSQMPNAVPMPLGAHRNPMVTIIEEAERDWELPTAVKMICDLSASGCNCYALCLRPCLMNESALDRLESVTNKTKVLFNLLQFLFVGLLYFNIVTAFITISDLTPGDCPTGSDCCQAYNQCTGGPSPCQCDSSNSDDNTPSCKTPFNRATFLAVMGLFQGLIHLQSATFFVSPRLVEFSEAWRAAQDWSSWSSSRSWYGLKHFTRLLSIFSFLDTWGKYTVLKAQCCDSASEYLEGMKNDAQQSLGPYPPEGPGSVTMEVSGSNPRSLSPRGESQSPLIRTSSLFCCCCCVGWRGPGSACQSISWTVKIADLVINVLCILPLALPPDNCYQQVYGLLDQLPLVVVIPRILLLVVYFLSLGYFLYDGVNDQANREGCRFQWLCCSSKAKPPVLPNCISRTRALQPAQFGTGPGSPSGPLASMLVGHHWLEEYTPCGLCLAMWCPPCGCVYCVSSTNKKCGFCQQPATPTDIVTMQQQAKEATRLREQKQKEREQATKARQHEVMVRRNTST